MRRFLLRQVLQTSASSVAVLAMTSVAGLAFARLLGPGEFGKWSALVIITMYAPYLSASLLEGLWKQIPLWIGQGDADCIDRAKRTAGTGYFSLVGLATVALLVFAATRQAGSDARHGMLAIAVIVLCGGLEGYMVTIFKAEGRFGDYNRMALLKSGLSLLAIVAVYRFRFTGLVASMALIQILGSLYALSRGGGAFSPLADWGMLRLLARKGAAIFAINCALNAQASVDRVLILAALSTSQLAYYSLARMAATLVLVGQTVGSVIYPRLGVRFGQSGQASDLKQPLMEATQMMCMASALAIGGTQLVLPEAIRLVLPAYAPAVVPARILVWGSYFSLAASVASYALVALGRARYYLAAIIVQAVVSLGAGYLFLRTGMSIDGVAVGWGLGALGFASVALPSALRLTGASGREGWRLAWSVCWPLGFVAATTSVIELLPRPGLRSEVMVAALQVAIFLGACAWLLVKVARGVGLTFNLSHRRTAG